LLDKYRLQY
jgi:hypothetical protein